MTTPTDAPAGTPAQSASSAALISPLLAPAAPSYEADRGRRPHEFYRLIRTRFEEIVRARDELKLSDRQAALSIGLHKATQFRRAYELLKTHGKDIVMSNDWSGVEKVVYEKFPHYLREKEFHAMMVEFQDPRPRETGAPELPVPPRAAKEQAPRSIPATEPDAVALEAKPIDPNRLKRRTGLFSEVAAGN